MGRVDGKVALITGGAKDRGMGAASARMLVAEGAKVVIGDVLDEEGAALAAVLGDAARYVQLDVTSGEDWKAAVDTAVREFGKLDVLVNNAGIVQAAPLKTADIERWKKVLDVNLTGPMRGIQAVIDPMIAAGGGSIVNISSIEGMRGAVWAHSYVASKWGLRGLTKSTALELAPENSSQEITFLWIRASAAYTLTYYQDTGGGSTQRTVYVGTEFLFDGFGVTNGISQVEILAQADGTEFRAYWLYKTTS